MASKQKPGYLQLKEAAAEVVATLKQGEPVGIYGYEKLKEALDAATADDKTAGGDKTKLGKLISALEQLPLGAAGYYHAAVPPYHRDAIPLVVAGLKLTLTKLLESKGETQQ